MCPVRIGSARVFAINGSSTLGDNTGSATQVSARNGNPLGRPMRGYMEL
jgi:hypothetical protein